MKEFLKTVLASMTGVLLASFVMLVMLFSLIGAIVASMEETPMIEENSVLLLHLDGALEERAADDSFSSIMSDEMAVLGLDDIIAAIKEAKDNANIKGIYLQAGMLSSSPASLEEIRGELASFKESGKFVVAYGDQYTQGMYYLATVADKVIVNPHGSIAWHGLASQPIFFKNLLEKLGVEMQIFKVGTYKSAVEPFIATEMSDANREQVSEYLNSTWNEMTAAVSASRGVSVENLNAYADRSMDLRQAVEYIDCGLADTLLYKDGVLDYLKTLTGTSADEGLNIVTLADIKEKLALDAIYKNPDREHIAVYYAYGEIDNSSSSYDEGINSEKVIRDLRKLREDKNVKAVVLRVNSPGGSAYGSEQIWREVSLFKGVKPIVVSMGDYAASGGYYISCAADRIVADNTTLTGSIGIFGMVPSAGKLLKETVGLGFDVVKTNALADMGDLSRTFTAEEAEIMQNYVNDGYSLFLKRCADGRGMSVEAIDSIAQGRVWTGEKAVKLGLVDEIGDLDRAVAIAADMAGVEGYSVESYPEMKDFITQLLETDEENYMEAMLQNTFGGYGKSLFILRGMCNGRPLQARLPFELNIR
jgi:protease-4